MRKRNVPKITYTCYSAVFFCPVAPVLDVSSVPFYLMKHSFPHEKWAYLAVGLKQAVSVPTIEASKGDVFAHLLALITHWVANDPSKTWDKLVDAVSFCKENVIAKELAEDFGITFPSQSSY